MAKKKLSNKQRALIREKTKNPTISNSEAMRRAGYSETTINGQNKRVIKSVEGGLRKAMEKAGITDELLAKALKRGILATKVQRAAHEGEFIDERVDQDLSTARGYVELAAKLRGDLIEAPDNNIQVNIIERPNLKALTKDELRTMIEISKKIENVRE